MKSKFILYSILLLILSEISMGSTAGIAHKLWLSTCKLSGGENEAAAGDMPRATIRFDWAYYVCGYGILYHPHEGLGQPHALAYASCDVVVSKNGRRSVMNAGHHSGPHAWNDSFSIDPLVDGFSGTIRVVIIHPEAGVLENLSRSWNLPRPGQPESCDSCKTGCETDKKISSIDIDVPLGGVTFGGEGNYLKFKSEDLSNPGRSALTFAGPVMSGLSGSTSNGGLLETIKVGNTSIMLVDSPTTEDPNRFQAICAYIDDPRDNPPTPVYRTITYEMVNGDFLLTDELDGVARTTVYSKPNAATWTMTEDGKRRTTRETTEETATDLVYLHTIEEMSDADNSWKVVSRTEEYKKKFGWGWETTKRVVDPGGLNLVSETDYYDSDGLNVVVEDMQKLGRIKSEKFPTGLIRTYDYLGTDPYNSAFSTVDVIQEHFAGTAGGKVTRIHYGLISGETGTLEEVFVGGQLVSKKEAFGSSGPSSRTERVYPAAGGLPLVTHTKFSSYAYETTYPDGTIERSVDVVTNGLLVRTISKGVKSSNGTIIRGTEEVTEINRAGTELRRINRAIYGGVAYRLEEKQLIQKDHRERPLRIDVFHGNNVAATYSELSQYSCCGLSYERGADGVPSYHYYDALRRRKKTHRNGMVEETVRDGLSVNTHRYPEAIISPNSEAAAANLLRVDTSNLNGETVQTQNRSPKDGALIATNYTISYNIGSGVGKRTVEVQPSTPDDGGVTPNIITDQYIDGETKSISGSLVVNRQFAYSANAVGIAVTESKIGGGGALFESTTTQTDFAGRTVKVSYTGDKDSNGIVDHASYTYDNGGKRKSFSDPDGVITLYSEDATTGQVTQAIDMNGNGVIDMNVDRIEMNTSGVGLVVGAVTSWSERAVRTSNEHGVSVTQLVSRSEQSPNGLSSREITYGPGSQLVTSQVNTPDSVHPGNRTITVVNSDSSSKVSTFASGLLQEEEAFDADSVSLYSITYTYDSHQRVATMTDSRQSGAITYTYVSLLLDLAIQSIQSGQVYTVAYDNRGRRVSEDAPDTLDASGASVSNTRTASYWPAGGIKEVNGTLGYRSIFTYDSSLRLETMTTFGSVQAITRWEYDADQGWFVRKRHNSPAPGQGTGRSYAYTPGGRLKTRTLARGISSTYSYDAGGMIEGITYSDATPAVTIQGRDQTGRITALNDVAGDLSISYNAWGNVASESYEGTGILSGWEVRSSADDQARVSSVSLRRQGTGVDEFGTQYRYDEAGRLEEVTSAGKAARYTYNPTTSAIRQISYFNQGQQVLLGNRQYDASNRLERITYHDGNLGANHRVYSDYRYTYDVYGRVSEIATKDGTVEKIKYNAVGEVVSSRRFLPGGVSSLRGRTFTWDYDGIGNRTSAGRGGDPSGAGLRNTGYTADASNRYSEITNPGAEDIVGTAAVSDSISIEGSAANRQGEWFHQTITAANGSGPVWKNTSVTNGTDAEDGSVLIPPANQIVLYDADGNLVSNGIYSFHWDGENRLITVETLVSAVAVGVPYRRVEYDYDSSFRRICREVFHAPGGPVMEYAGFLWRGRRCMAEISSVGMLAKSYVWGNDGNGEFHFEDGNGALLWMDDLTVQEVHFYHYDRGGNVVGLSNQGGNKSAGYRYGAFGEMLEQEGYYANRNLFRFSTKEWDDVAMMYYFGYRFYDPIAGRWSSMDPIGERGGVNLYGMVGNDAVNQWDALGLEPVKAIPVKDVKPAGNCEIVIYVGHDDQVAKLLGDQLGGIPGDAPKCTKYGGMSCNGDKINEKLRDMFDRENLTIGVGMDIGAYTGNTKGLILNRPFPDDDSADPKTGRRQNAPQIMDAIKARVKKYIAPDLCRTPCCKGKQVTFKFVLIGYDKDWLNPFVSNFETPAWGDRFKPEIIPCQ